MLLELAKDCGLVIKKTANSQGGEYHSGCPACGEGVDRFVIWPQLNRYWCRRCEVKGDAIQFCRDFMDMSFRQARERINDRSYMQSPLPNKQLGEEKLLLAKTPSSAWQERALAFINWGQIKLTEDSGIKSVFYQRGLQDETLTRFKLGYCINSSSAQTHDFYRERFEWGLSCEYREDGKARKLWLPHGIIIPTLSMEGHVLKLKVRRHKWTKEDSLPKYVEIVGSMQCPSVYGSVSNKVAIVLESELDAILIQQEVPDACFCVALGGSTKKPDVHTDQLLRRCVLILWSLDNDDAGKKEAFWWREKYSQLRFWPVPIGKSPGDALQYHQINLREWILKGIAHYIKDVKKTEESAKHE